jgi:hypothetical protein
MSETLDQGSSGVNLSDAHKSGPGIDKFELRPCASCQATARSVDWASKAGVNADEEKETRAPLDPLSFERVKAKSDVMNPSLGILEGRRLSVTLCNTARAFGAEIA